MVDRMVKSSGVARSDIECVAFSAGPGSFTGVRLGAAVAQGIAEAWGALVCPVPTAESMARQVAAWQTELTEFHLARPSRQHLAYISTFNTKGGELACTESDRLLDLREFKSAHAVIHGRDLSLSALQVIELALDARGRWCDAAEAQPVYVEGDSPWTPNP